MDFGDITFVLVLFAFSLILMAVAIYFVVDYRRKTQKEVSELSSRLEQVEKEYLKSKPQIEEIRQSLDDLVDYPAMEKKLRELISFVGERVKTKK